MEFSDKYLGSNEKSDEAGNIARIGCLQARLPFNFDANTLTMHLTTEPAILYFGTPVVLISSENENGSYNLAPVSSAFWLGWRSIIGVGSNTQTAGNLLRNGQCVLSLPSVNEVAIVNKLALLTGRNPVPPRKQLKGYRYEPNKFDIAGATPIDSEIVSVPGVKECPVQLEAIVKAIHPIAEDEEELRNRMLNIELKIVRVRIVKRSFVEIIAITLIRISGDHLL